LKQLKIINNNGLVLQNITLPNEHQLANTIPTNLVHLPTYHTPHLVFPEFLPNLINYRIFSAEIWKTVVGEFAAKKMVSPEFWAFFCINTFIF